MEKLFQLKKHNTNVRTEVIGGLTTFFAMAYIIFVNPNFLSRRAWITPPSCWPPAFPPLSAVS